MGRDGENYGRRGGKWKEVKDGGQKEEEVIGAGRKLGEGEKERGRG